MNRDAARGSILITSLWMVSVLSIVTASLTREAFQHLDLMKREIRNFQDKEDLISGMHAAAARILADVNPYEDSGAEAWYGPIVLEPPWANRIQAVVQDEEAKINLNYATREWLEGFFKAYENDIESLRCDRKDFVEAIFTARGEKGMAVLEELLLIEDIDGTDVARLRPYVTVYPELQGVNLNTVEPIVLESLIDSLPGDAFAKRELLRKIEEFRRDTGSFFKSDDLLPEPFSRLLKLTQSPQMLMLVGQLLPKVTVDSRTFSLFLKTRHGSEARVILRAKNNLELKVLDWREI